MPSNKRFEDFNPCLDRFFNFVPCNKCEECLSISQEGYRTRAVFHYYDCIKNGGCAFYYTLTYNEESIPKYNNIRCFDSKVLKDFIKRLRKFLPDGSLSYFITSEFGDDTLRPHHHAVFYLNYKEDRGKFYDYVRLSWATKKVACFKLNSKGNKVPLYRLDSDGKKHRVFKEIPRLGFIKPGDNLGLIDSPIACYYCAKYVKKNTNYLEYLESNNFTSVEVKEFEQFKKRSRSTLSLKPIHFQSIGFGLGMLDYLCDNDFVNGFIVTNDIFSVINRFSIPLYIMRKHMYNTYYNSVGNVIYRLNDVGVKIQESKMFNKIKNLSKDFQSLFEISKSRFNSCEFVNKSFHSYNEFEYFVYNTLQGDLDFVNLSSWYVLYHDVDFEFKFKDIKSDLNLYLENLPYNHDLPFMPKSTNCSRYYEMNYFKGFDFLVKCLFAFKSYLKYDKYVDRTLAYNVMQRNRSFESGLKPKYIKVKSFKSYCGYE